MNNLNWLSNSIDIRGYNYQYLSYCDINIGDVVLIKDFGNNEYHIIDIVKDKEDGRILVKNRWYDLKGNWRFGETSPKKIISSDDPKFKNAMRNKKLKILLENLI